MGRSVKSQMHRRFSLLVTAAGVVLMFIIVTIYVRDTTQKEALNDMRNPSKVSESEAISNLVHTIKKEIGDNLAFNRCLIMNDICLACIERNELSFIRLLIGNYYEKSISEFNIVLVGNIDNKDIDMLGAQLFGQPLSDIPIHSVDIKADFTIMWVDFIRSMRPIIISGNLLRETSINSQLMLERY